MFPISDTIFKDSSKFDFWDASQSARGSLYLALLALPNRGPLTAAVVAAGYCWGDVQK